MSHGYQSQATHLSHPQASTRQSYVEAGERMLALERAKMTDLHKGIRDLRVRILGVQRACVCVHVCVRVCARM